jgi:non-ribosomal peptide synthase protein (TIGR01720 family)
MANDSAGQRNLRKYLLEFNAFTEGGELKLIITYSQEFHRQSEVEELARHYMKNLRALIAHCESPDAGGYTPSDFAKARVNQKDLDKLLSKIARSSPAT